MTVSLKKPILNFDGSVINKGEGDTLVPLTFMDVLIVSITSPLEGDDKDTGELRVKKFNILESLYKSKGAECDFDSEDAILIKERVLKVYPSPVIYKRVCELLGDKS